MTIFECVVANRFERIESISRAMDHEEDVTQSETMAAAFGNTDTILLNDLSLYIPSLSRQYNQSQIDSWKIHLHNLLYSPNHHASTQLCNQYRKVDWNQISDSFIEFISSSLPKGSNTIDNNNITFAFEEYSLTDRVR